MKQFKFWNNIVGWAVFAIAAITYLLTMEPSSSLWDCGEFIATSYKLEVGHPPGAPLFMILARLATMLAPSTHYVPHMVNAMNCIASAFTILFLFWTITHIARRLFTATSRKFDTNNQWSAIIAGAIGALAYTFTDTFWFSAVEGEVYALSSMFTALVVWLMMKWEEQADEPHAMRWILLITYLMGLSIGVHILNLLTIPALVYIYYFRKYPTITWKGLFGALLVSGAILLLINSVIIKTSVWVGAMIDTFFVNNLGLPINSGLTIYALALILGLGYGAYVAHTKGKQLLNMVLLCVTMLFVGYTSYASVVIRASVNPPMNSNNPSNAHSLYSFLNREQYGSRPLIYGASYAAPVEDYSTREIYYINDEGKYEKIEVLKGAEYPQEFMRLFPRMWNNMRGEAGYKPWAAYRTEVVPAQDAEGNLLRDASGKVQMQNRVKYGKEVKYNNETIVEPTFGEDMYYFFTYQLNYMFWRYFLWNFVGRQSDIQASNITIADGNWRSGFDAIDQAYIGPQDGLPREIEHNRGRNAYYFLPFILGLLGLIYQLNRDPKNFSIVMWLFIMMGVALVVYFNTSPAEVRERDYVFAGAFYAFSIWIGLGVLAIRDFIDYLTKGRAKKVAIVGAAIVTLSVPAILASENWDDHDRSGRTMARDIGWNYLQSTLPNSIIINYGDNDTFPLWFNQEVDEVRTDVKIMNSSYLGGEWYIDQMKTRANEADAVPISLPKSKYSYDTNTYLYIIDRIERPVAVAEVIDFIRSNDKRTKFEPMEGLSMDYIPTSKLVLPVNKANVLASGVVKPEDEHLIVDSIYFNLPKTTIDRSEMIMLDMLATNDWKRPIYFTQPFILQNLGLVDYLQFDGYGYRLVPIKTTRTSGYDIGRIDPEYNEKLLLETFRYGNLSDPDVYVDNFIQYNLSASKAREAFARTAMAFIDRGEMERGITLLDRGLEVLPTSQIRYTEANTLPFIEGYYSAGERDKGDELLTAYATNIIEYIEYYLRFEGYQADLVTTLIDDRLDELSAAYQLGAAAQSRTVIGWLNEYYRTLGATDEDLIIFDDSSSNNTESL